MFQQEFPETAPDMNAFESSGEGRDGDRMVLVMVEAGMSRDK